MTAYVDDARPTAGASGTPVGDEAAPHDLTTRADIEALLIRFYTEAFRDELLAEPFADLSSRGLDEHLPVMCDFWETVLFRAGLYRRNTLRAHRPVHDETPLTAEHFARWLSLWTTTIDQMYRGPVADHAKLQAARIATAMHRRLTGTHAPQLAALTDSHR
nr:group III truncated hemoglobin [Mycolicibacterium malmesburyense]CRL66649.1 hypothetical protein CPGR_00053 [Mycolicibacterium malmesburyense]